ncbi:MAG: condensation domain-containing protein, partial [Pseudonocardiaceae bacterium]
PTAARADRDAAWELAGQEAVQRIRVETGPLVQAVLGDMGQAGQWLAIAIHHLGVDQVSWFTLIADLEWALAGRLDMFGPAPSYLAWSADQPQRATSPGVEAAAAFWSAQLEELGTDGETADAGTEADSERLLVRLPAGETHPLIHGAHDTYHATPLDVLCAALTAAYSHWAAEPCLRLALESNGRAGSGAWSGAVGWFTAVYPVVLPVSRDPGATLAMVKDRLRAVPDDGSFGLLRYLHPTWSKRLLRSPEPPLSLNYLARLDPQPAMGRVLRPLPQDSFLARGPQVRRGHRLEVTVLIINDALVAEFCWNGRHDSRAAVLALADRFLNELRRLARHLTEHGGPGLTPSDFVHVDLDARELGAILAEVTKTPDDPH